MITNKKTLLRNDEEANVLALIKGKERYIWIFTDECRAETLQSLGRFASNPDLSFSWYEAAILSQKVRESAKAPVVTRERRNIPPTSADTDRLIF